MTKTIDLNEKTLEREKKSFLSFCNAAHILIVIALCLTIAVTIVGIFVCIVVHMDGNDELTKEKYELFSVIHSVITYIGFGIALKHGEIVFKKLKSGEAPFTYDIADKIKAIGITHIATAGGRFAVETVRNLLMLTGILNGNLKVTFDLEMLLGGFIMCALAYIFNYGCKLQQESDETL